MDVPFRLSAQKSCYFDSGTGCALISFAGSCNFRDVLSFGKLPEPAKTEKLPGIFIASAIVMIKIRYAHIHTVYSDCTQAAPVSDAMIKAKAGAGKGYLQRSPGLFSTKGFCHDHLRKMFPQIIIHDRLEDKAVCIKRVR